MKKLSTAQISEINHRSSYQSARLVKKLADAVKLATDSDSDSRLKARECAVCYYTDAYRISGQAFTNWNCEYCGLEGRHPNTGVPKMCNQCGDLYKLCIECGCSLDLKKRRK